LNCGCAARATAAFRRKPVSVRMARAGRLEIVPDERVEIGDVGAVEVGHVGNDGC
jgi:hypothetical protein